MMDDDKGPRGFLARSIAVNPGSLSNLRKPLKTLRKNFPQVCRLIPRFSAYSNHEERANNENHDADHRVVNSASSANPANSARQGMGGMPTVWTRYGKGMRPLLTPSQSNMEVWHTRG